MSNKYPDNKNLNLPDVGTDILAYWKKNSVFEKSVISRKGLPSFTFFEGPPSANGTPGIHHVMARTVKDIFCRYKTLKGYQVKRKGGWDTHGLPVELQVEKELGITKDDIGKKISVEQYNQKCREAVMKYKSQWDDLTEKMGYWVDLDDPYITFENNYIETCWYLLKELYKKDLLYKGYTIQPYSPAAGTGLSSHELNQPGAYRDVKDTTVVAQFKAKNFQSAAEGDVYFLAWTTTPWTLPSNAALAVGENIDYLLVKTFNQYTHLPINIILAKALLPKFVHEKGKDGDFAAFKAGDKVIPWTILGEYKGRDLVGTSYEQLLPYVTPEQEAFRVIPGDFVSTEDGTGIVHIAPTFGADDARVAKAAGIPPIVVKDENDNEVPLVDKRGRFVSNIVDEVFGFGGEFVKEEYLNDDEKAAELARQQTSMSAIIAKLDKYMSVDERLALKLKLDNKAFRVEKYEHSYPHCWRTDKPILYYPLDSWFIRTTTLKSRMSELNKEINWKPESTGTGRFGNWLDNLVDWNLSRSRYWGTPLPIWRSEDGSEEKCIGSLDELQAEMKKSLAVLDTLEMSAEKKTQAQKFMKLATEKGIEDLHRPYVDYIVLVSDSGKAMFREADLIDVWFDSGAMPYAQWHYMGEKNSSAFGDSKDGHPFTADFISEGVDQTRGWFFTLHALSTLLRDKIAFKNVVSTGLVLDKNGVKMSKRIGNVINPFETIDNHGPDATRWYMIGNAPPWDNLKFNLDGVTEVLRRFFGTLQNTYSFFALYSNLDGFTYKEKDVPMNKRTESDRWILSRLNSLIAETDEAYNDYDATRAVRAIEGFVCDDLSNWYVRLNRKRFWKGEYSEDKMAAYQTLYTCLETVAKLASPVAPFYCERLFLDLNGVSKKENEISVHLTKYPTADTALIDKDLEQKMGYAQRMTSLIHSIRKGNSLRVRQPLSKVLIPVLNDTFRKQIAAVQDLILSEVNVKTMEFMDDSSGILVKKVKPNFKKLGKEYGAKLKEVGAIIQAFSQQDISSLERNGNFPATLTDGTAINITPEDVEISFDDIPGWLVAIDGNLTVALDITLSDELIEEGLARDFVNRIQNLRKDLGLEVQDKVKIQVKQGIHLKSEESSKEILEAMVLSALAQHASYVCSEVQALGLAILEDIEGDIKKLDMDEFELEVSIVVSKDAVNKDAINGVSTNTNGKGTAKDVAKKQPAESTKKPVKKATKKATAVVKKAATKKPVKKAPAKKTTVKKATAKKIVKKTTTKKTVAKKATKPAAKKVVKKAVAKKVVKKTTAKATTPAKKAVAKTVAKKQVVAKKVAKPVAKKTTKAKAVAKKAVAKKLVKPAAKKVVAKKAEKVSKKDLKKTLKKESKLQKKLDKKSRGSLKKGKKEKSKKKVK